MATHPRKVIRKAIADHLKTQTGDPLAYRTAAGLRVFDSSDTPGDVDDGKEINVYSPGETIDDAYQHEGGIRRRIMDLRIECYHYGGAGGEGADELAWQVETAMRDNPTVGNLVEWCKLKSVNIYFAEQGDVALWCAVMSWEVIYYTHDTVDEGERPTIVMLGFSPEIGLGNEPDYVQVTPEDVV